VRSRTSPGSRRPMLALYSGERERRSSNITRKSDMNESSTDASAGAPCEECLAWQRLLDEELNMDAAELLLHHLKSCRACAETARGLKQAKSLCEELLGLEDEGEEEFSDQVLARVRFQVETARPARRPAHFSRRWRRYVVAAAALILAGLVMRLSFW